MTMWDKLNQINQQNAVNFDKQYGTNIAQQQYGAAPQAQQAPTPQPIQRPAFNTYKPAQRPQGQFLNALSPTQQGQQIQDYMSSNNMYNPQGQNASFMQRFNHLFSNPGTLNNQAFNAGIGLLGNQFNPFHRYMYGRR